MNNNNHIPSEAAVSVLRQIQNSNGIWSKGWKGSLLKAMRPFNPITGTVYHGTNAMNLYLPLLEKIISDPSYKAELRYSTMRQLNMHKAGVKKGGKAKYISCFKPIIFNSKNKIMKVDSLQEGLTIDRGAYQKVVKRRFGVFNYDDVEWYDSQQKEKYDQFKIDDYDSQTVSSNLKAEKLLKSCGARLMIGTGMQPCFAPNENIIYIPRNEDFAQESSKWEALFHELIHWTKLNLAGCERNFCYAQEELTAELGSLMLCQEFEVNFVPGQRDGMYDYLHNWLKPFVDEASKLIAIDEALAASDRAVKALLATITIKG